MRQIVVDLVTGAGLLSLQEALYFPFGDRDLGDHIPLHQRVEDHLVAHVLAILDVIDALCGHRRRQFGQGQPVPGGDALERPVQHLVGHPDTQPEGPLQLDLLDDQLFQDLLLDRLAGRHLTSRLPYLAGDQLHLRVHLALEDDAFIDDGDDTVEQNARVAQRLWRLGRCRLCEQGRGEREQELTHGRLGDSVYS